MITDEQVEAADRRKREFYEAERGNPDPGPLMKLLSIDSPMLGELLATIELYQGRQFTNGYLNGFLFGVVTAREEAATREVTDDVPR